MQTTTIPAQGYNPGTPVFYGIQTVYKGLELKTLLLERARANREKAAETESRIGTVREKAHEIVNQLPESMRQNLIGDARAQATRPLVRRERNFRRLAAGLEFIATHLAESATYVLSGEDVRELDLVPQGAGYNGLASPILGYDDDDE